MAFHFLRDLTNCVVFVLTASFIAGCAAKPVRVVDEPEFVIMARRIAPVLRERNILDDEGAYATSILTASLPEQLGESLFHRLSPAFRFQVDPSLLPATFAASRTRGDSLEMRPYGFVLGQGIETVSVSLLAQLDWDENGSEDWLLLCRIASLQGVTLRDYYLLVEHPETDVLRPRVIAVYDCYSRTCKLFVPVSNEKKLPITPETPVIDVEAGERDITLPPETPSPTDAPQLQLREQKLGG